jgi:glycosyltransferase involved in cell wall biosynthesis
VIFTIGRIVKEKGYHNVIEALPGLRRDHGNLHVVVAGMGPYLDDLRALAGDLGVQDHVTFAGRVDAGDLPALYNLADVFVTATERQEGLPIIILEAMSCGRPTIASHIGGIPNIITSGKDGILSPPGDVPALERDIARILDDDPYARRMGKAARETIRREFSQERMVERTLDVYKTVM